MKTIFYVLSVLVIGASAYFTHDNSSKLQTEIDTFAEVRGKKVKVEGNITSTNERLTDNEAPPDPPPLARAPPRTSPTPRSRLASSAPKPTKTTIAHSSSTT